MSYRWEKLGLIFAPKDTHPWMISHAANPVAVPLGGTKTRVYFSCRDSGNHAHVGFVDIDLKDPTKVLAIAQEPVLGPGKIGLFDDSGTSLSCITQIGGKRFMYYLGWNLGVTVPWRNSIGLAIENLTTGKFEKYSEAPLMDRDATDPYTISYPFVFKDGDVYRMWYGSNLTWGAKQEEMAHVLKYAESSDGLHWKRSGRVAIGFEDKSEYAISRACVRKENGLYKMWYSYRGQAYRIGYAESHDALQWTRKDKDSGITVSSEGWDSESVEYPHIFDQGGETYLLYNGNKYGATGVGIARAIR